MSSSATACRRGAAERAPPAPRSQAFERASDPKAALRLPPPPVFARKLGRAPHLAPPNPSLPEPLARVPMLPAPASFSSSLRRCPLFGGRDEGARNWATLPRDAITAVLRKLDHVEILIGLGQVCRSWRRAARDYPALWRRIDLRGHAHLNYRVDLCEMAWVAIRRAKGQCEAFWAEHAANDGVLQFLGNQAPSLKSLRLISCQDILKFEKEIKKFPLLEELEISLFTNIGGKNVFEQVGKACPELKHFRFNQYCFINMRDSKGFKDDDALGIASMHGLLSLQLFGNKLSNKGLMAVLDNCPHLESLDMRHCFNIIMDNKLRARFARIKTLRLPNDSTDDYQYPVCSSLGVLGIESCSDDYGDDYSDDYSDDCSDDYAYCWPDYIMDSDDYDDYCDPFRYLDGVYESELNVEDRMFLKGFRMLMKDSDDDDY
ncbi:hypothetical protein PR202_ga27475 [Eleusine coracana subsp. coracana]|uniref:F-box domain-containing protein n=1 Tax=Eleusine coracana subsp. coracana TaxID=191504 RepID=A0AAV5DGB7_ELECO|nr:hypothetical protein QOZ80_8AG0620260 [Eleusine coracana subsp. coracana]GJN09466.1 hypothetical protein PR202_ga27475 [Eleusine coracana subsp. coracana]